MNHAQACAPLQLAAALQAVYQFMHEQGFESSAEMLAEESGIPETEALASSPATLLTALSAYDAARGGAFKVRQADPGFVAVNSWIQSLRDSPEVAPTAEWRKLSAHTGNVIACTWQPKAGSLLYATGSADKTISVCSAESNTVLRRIHASGPVLSLHFNPARPTLLLATCMNGGHSVVDIEKAEGAELLQAPVDHKKYVVCGKWSPDGVHYATGSHDGFVHVYGPAAAESAAAPAAAAAAAAAAVAPAAAAADAAPAQWRLLSRVEFSANVESLEWIDATSFYCSVREDNYLHHISIANGVREVAKYNTNEFGDDHISFNVLDLALAPGGKAILVATDKHRVILMQVGSSAQIRNFYNLLNDGYSTPRLAWGPSGKFAYCTSQDNSVAVLDVASGKTVHSLRGHEINVRDVAVSADNRALTCSFDKSSRVWQAEVQ